MLAMPPIHSTSLQFVAGLYVFAGLAVKGIVLFRGLKSAGHISKANQSGIRETMAAIPCFMFLAATDWHPVGIVFQILLWLVFSTQRVQKWLEGDDSSG